MRLSLSPVGSNHRNGVHCKSNLAASHRRGLAIRDYLNGMPPNEGVTGTTQFDENGDCNTKPFVRQRIEGGEYVDIEPEE